MDTTNLCMEDIPANVSRNDEKSADISKSDLILQQVQHLIDNSNAKAKPEALVSQYRNDLEKHVDKRCRLMHQRITNMYQEHSRVMQEKLDKLGYCLQQAAKAETELQEFKSSLKMLYQDMQETARF